MEFAQDSDTINLIVIDDSSNDAETVSNRLRNNGYAVRTIAVSDDDELRVALNEDPVMVVTKPELPELSAIDTLSAIAHQERDVPVVVLDDGSSVQATDLLKAGARDVVDHDDLNRLGLVLLREWQDLWTRHHYRQCRLQLQQANARAQALVDTSRDAVAYVHDGMHIYANPPYLQLFGYSDFEEIAGMPIMNMVAEGEREQLKGFLRALRTAPGSSESIELDGLRATGKQFRITLECSPAVYDDEACTQLIIRDQGSQRQAPDKSEDLSRQDALTGLYNRKFFLEQLGKRITTDHGSGAVLFMEPDNFSEVRDRIGVTGADMFISRLGELLERQANDDGILARMDGQLFAMLLPSDDPSVAEENATSLIDAMDRNIMDFGGTTLNTTLSVGIALFDNTVSDPQLTLSRADQALRQAKEMGGNRFNSFNPAALEKAGKEQASRWATQLKLALRDGKFRLLFQPIVSLHGDPYENYEVLLRMLDANGKEIMPGEFLPAAEQVGLMTAVDRWVLANATKVLATRQRHGRRTNLFVKLSTTSLKDPELLPWLRKLLSMANLKENSLTLELSEQVAQTNLKHLKLLAGGLGQLHVKSALDHFGIAPNSFNLLRNCGADFLKIDGSLIRGLSHDASLQNKVRELTAEAKEMGKQTIAEFVEDANTLAVLWSCGIDYIQGYFLQRPDTHMRYDFSTHTDG